MKLTIAKIDQTIFEGEFESLIVPGEIGEMEIMPGHTALLSALKKGKITYVSNGHKEEFEIEKGFVEVNNNEVIVVL